MALSPKSSRNLFLAFILILIILVCVVSVVKLQHSDNKTDPRWEFINARPIPEWYDQSKFGIFIHWGVYSVPAFSNKTEPSAEWYWDTWKRKTDSGWTEEYHNRSFGSNFTYQEFAPMFTAHLYDTERWADLIQKSGARYVVLTSKHHEGFTLWPNKQSNGWNAVDQGPRRDLVGELSQSIRNRGIHMGLYFSLYEWFNPLYIADKSTGKPPKSNNYITEVMLPQMHDLVETYKPDILWTDGEWEQKSEYWKSAEFLTWLFENSSVSENVVINDRWGKDCRGKNGGFWTGGDRFNPGHLLPHKFENCATISTSWGYNQFEDAHNYQSTEQLIRLLVETVSCGGNLLLNIGPTKEGIIVIAQQQSLIGIGEWLDINGEAIYNSIPWRVQNESNVWYTFNENQQVLYGISLGWPEDNQITLKKPITNSKTDVKLLGYSGGSLSYSPIDKNGGMIIKLPYLTPGKYPPHNVYTFKITNIK